MEKEEIISALAVIEFAMESALNCPVGMDEGLLRGCLTLVSALKDKME